MIGDAKKEETRLEALLSNLGDAIPEVDKNLYEKVDRDMRAAWAIAGGSSLLDGSEVLEVYDRICKARESQ